MTKKLISFLMIGLVVFASTAALTTPAAAQAGTPQTGLVVPINFTIPAGVTIPAALAGATSIVGNFTINSFRVVNGALAAVGTLSVNVLNAAGTVLGTFTLANVVASITQATGSCTILQLDIGAIHLDLLGLVVDLSPIHLNITAQSGPGNLLGNLLCAIANLLNNGGPLSQLANLLNQLLAQL